MLSDWNLLLGKEKQREWRLLTSMYAVWWILNGKVRFGRTNEFRLVIQMLCHLVKVCSNHGSNCRLIMNNQETSSQRQKSNTILTKLWTSEDEVKVLVQTSGQILYTNSKRKTVRLNQANLINPHLKYENIFKNRLCLIWNPLHRMVEF